VIGSSKRDPGNFSSLEVLSRPLDEGRHLFNSRLKAKDEVLAFLVRSRDQETEDRSLPR